MNDFIFVSISAWREETLEETINSAINNAKFPELLRFGVVFQGYERDSWMIEKIKNYANVQIVILDAKTASPYLCNIRGDLALSLTSDEMYYLQIDAHSKFHKNWDCYLKKELEIATRAFGKSFLTEPTTGFEDWDTTEKLQFGMTSEVDQDWFDKWKEEVIVGRNEIKQYGYQSLERFYFATMVFGYLKDFYICRQPRNISFDLEQPFQTLRVYTAGYNMVSPSHTYINVYDFKSQSRKNKILNKNSRFDDQYQIKEFNHATTTSRQRYKEVVENKIVDIFDGLYDTRSLDDFINFAGYQPVSNKVLKETKSGQRPEEINVLSLETLQRELGLINE